MPPPSPLSLSLSHSLAQAQSLAAQGQTDAARHLALRCLAATPFPAAETAARPLQSALLHFSGVLSAQAGDLREGLKLLQQAHQLTPTDGALLNNLGSLLLSAEDWTQAEDILRAALVHAPKDPSPASSLGNLLLRQARYEEAHEAYRLALRRDSTHFPALYGLASAFLEQGNIDSAISSAMDACFLHPQRAEGYFALGNAYRAAKRLSVAVESFEHALTLAPDYAAALTNLANTLAEQGRPEESLARFQQALLARPQDRRYASNYLCALHYVADVTPEGLAEAHQWWADRFAPPSPPPRSRPAHLRTIGFVSPDFGQHPIGWFLAPLLEAPPPDSQNPPCRYILYSDRPASAEDALTHRLATAAGGFHRIAGLSDDQVGALIEKDSVDLLIDLAGHTAGNRLSLFARRAAPRQVTWAGYVGTTGLAAMDGLLADAWQIPFGDEDLYKEQIIRLPHAYVPYEAPADAPPVAPLPCLRGAPFTFGSFNNPAKISTATLARWSALLCALPQTRLLLKFRGLEDPSTGHRLRQSFAQYGVASERILLQGGASHHHMLEAYQDVDLGLDPTPYSGGLTSLESLWMGVPVLTLPGRTFASRHSLAHQQALGLSDFCCQSLEELIEQARRWIAAPQALAELRAGLRDRFRQCPTGNGSAFRHGFEESLHRWWRESPTP